MRKKRTSQMSIYEIFAEHEIATELNKISNWLDTHTEALDWGMHRATLPISSTS